MEIYDKIIAITCDGGENLIAAVEKLGGSVKRIWCCSHRLHLVVINALGFWNKEKANDDNQTTHSSTETLTSVATSTSAATTTSIIMSADVLTKSQNEPMDTSCFNDDEMGKFFIS